MAASNNYPGRWVMLGTAWLALYAGLIGNIATAFESPEFVMLGVFRELGAHIFSLFFFAYCGGFVTIVRAVVHDHWWSWAAPVSCTLGTVLLFLNVPHAVPAVFFLFSFVILTAIYFSIFVQQARLGLIIQATGALAGFCAVGLWALELPHAQIFPLALTFVLCTSVGERAGSNRIVFSTKRMENLLVVASLGMFGFALMAVPLPSVGSPFFGIYLLLAGGLMWRFDACWRDIQLTGIYRFRGTAVMASYFWSVLVGGILLAFGYFSSGPGFDAVFFGYLFGSVVTFVIAGSAEYMAIVFKRLLVFGQRFYIPLFLIQVGILIQVIGGDARGINPLWQIGLVVATSGTCLWFPIAYSSATSRVQPLQLSNPKEVVNG